MSDLPRIHLAIDNCFASKRWITPDAWAREIAALGLRSIEASADTENDPCYQPEQSFRDWADTVTAAEQAHGVSVDNLYSGHGSYATCGLAHPDERVRAHLRDRWLTPMIEQAARLEAGLGFFCHAFGQDILQDAHRHAAAVDMLIADLAILARRAADHGVTAGVEQMYTPHQVPWTLAGATGLLQGVYAASGCPWYLTIDVGHASGQHRFQRPSRAAVEEAIAVAQAESTAPTVWVGSERAQALLQEALRTSGRQRELVDRICADMEANPQFFAVAADGDPYAWLEALAPWSPIVHLQQTDGTVSKHWPFTAAHNAAGIISGERVLNAIAAAWQRPPTAGMPAPVQDLYLTIEVFSGTADTPQAIRERLHETVAYWRRFVPADGLPLQQLLTQPALG